MKLSELVGTQILIRAIPLHETQSVTVKLISMDEGGIWVESQKVTEDMLEHFERSAASRTPIVFLPYAQIAWVMHFSDKVALSEKALGVDKP